MVAQQPPVQPPSDALPAGVDEEAVSTLVAITSKPRDLVVQALSMAQGNADLACTLLLEGINPDMMQQMMGGGAGVAGGADDYGQEYGQEDPGAGQMPPGMGGVDNSAFANLMQNPQMPQLAQRLRENPQFYQEFMTRLQTQDPQLFAAIQANPMAFMNLVMGGNPNLPGMAGAGSGAGAGGQAAAPRRAPGSIQVSPVEMEAIQRLQTLGFSQHAAAEAYFSCDKNEEMAANFLFESGMDDDAAMMQAAMAQSAASAGVQPVLDV